MRTALCTGEIHLVHLSRTAVHTAAATAHRAAAATCPKTVRAVHRAISRRLKGQFRNLFATVAALKIHLVHLPILLIHSFGCSLNESTFDPVLFGPIHRTIDFIGRYATLVYGIQYRLFTKVCQGSRPGPPGKSAKRQTASPGSNPGALPPPENDDG